MQGFTKDDEEQAFENYIGNSNFFMQQFTKLSTPQKRLKHHRTYNRITKIITGNPYVHSGDIYKKTSIYPRQPFWSFTNI